MTKIKLEDALVRNYQRYLEYNILRKERLLTLMPQKKQPLFYALPFLLHINHPCFPGFIDGDDAVHGISRYNPDKTAMNNLRKIFHENDLQNLEPYLQIPEKNSVIKSLLLMGSLGTVAQNRDSDFDFWVCVSLDRLSSDQACSLGAKLSAVEAWADQEYALEVHFFITDIKSVRSNRFGTADKESAGTSQARLLKEEFYRTSILVAGKTPFWWIVAPKTSDKAYKEAKETVKKSKNIRPEMFIDLGNLNQISSDEFFGAAIWQICKAMDSPYKSVLKMAILAAFLDPDEKQLLLCDSMKYRVQQPTADQRNPRYYDPYTILFDTIQRYYQKKHHQDDLDLFRTCLYIKTGVMAGNALKGKRSLNFKERIISSYVKKWDWSDERISHLNAFMDWDFDQMIDLGYRVHHFMIAAYQDLSRMLKESGHKTHMISPQDLTVIGRKLESFYSVKQNKINYIRRAFSEGLFQESISLSALAGRNHSQIWSLYRGKVNQNDLKESSASKLLLKKGGQLIEVLVWALFNKLITKKSSLYLLPNPFPVTMNEIQNFVERYLELFPQCKISSLSNEALLSQEKAMRFFFVINFGVPKWVHNIEKITVVYSNSWGELFCFSKEEDPEVFLNQFISKVSREDTGLVDMMGRYHFYIPQGDNFRELSVKVDHIANRSYFRHI
ncbi:MAG: class I adenylate cyclase [Deltaproteobacteria bacterium]|nr:class I adenylate cyclase [Deltaproteobacteria bacterium]